MARELVYHEAEVVSTEEISPHLTRLVIGGDGVASWSSSGAPDEALLLVVPDDGSVTMPDQVDDGDPYARSRWYTVRRVDRDRQQITVDVVGHDVGLATRWARSARPGDPVGISSTSTWFSPPDDAGWVALFGDITALPAFGRIIEESTVPVTAFVEVPDLADAQDELGDGVTWISNPTLARSGSDLETIVRSWELPDGPGYVYVAGEAAATRAVRKYLRHEQGRDKRSYSVVGYWRARAEEWNLRFERSGIDLERVYAEGESAGLDPEELSDVVDRRLDAAGL